MAYTRLNFLQIVQVCGVGLVILASDCSLAFSSGKIRKAKPQTGCYVPNPVVGTTCDDGSIYIGRDSANRKLVTPPGNCSHEPSGTHMTTPTEPFTPTCTGTLDASVAKAYGAYTFSTSATSVNDGRANTIHLAENYTTTRAAKYCYYMRYAGRDDWYIPAKNELNLFWSNRVLLQANPTFGVRTTASYYWSSTQYNTTHAWVQKFDDGQQFSGGNRDNNVNGNLVRCIRRHP